MLSSSTIIRELPSSRFDSALKTIYGENELEKQKERLQKLLAQFEKEFGPQPVAVLSGPGRTELSGNHTDHQNGQVICASVNLDIQAAVSANEQNRIRILSEGFEPLEIDLNQLESQSDEINSSKALVRGIASFLKKKGYKTGGFDAVLHSAIPSGSGLSSSAAYEILIAQIFNHLYNYDSIDPVTLAKAGQYAENHYFGKPSGLMDQMGSAIGQAIAIDFSRPQQPSFRQLPLVLDEYILYIVDTRSSHAGLSAEYGEIPREMTAVARLLGKEKLGQLRYKDILSAQKTIREQLGDRAFLRALHFFEENGRVLGQSQALLQQDLDTYLELVRQSGLSSEQLLQNIWSVKRPMEQPVSLALALGKRILGSQGAIRVHGGGFGGTVQAYVPVQKADLFGREMEELFGKGCLYPIRIREKGGTVLIS